MATITAAAGGGNWTTGATWVGGVAPTAADDAVLDATSGNVTIDSGAVCRSLDCNGYTGTLTHNGSVAFNIGDGTAGAGNRAIRLSSGMTYTPGDNFSSFRFISTSATQQTLDFAGLTTLAGVAIAANGGSYLLASNVTLAGSFSIPQGTFDDGGRSVTALQLSSSGASTRSLTLTGTWTVTNNGAPVAMGSSGITFTATGSTIIVSDASASNKTFVGAGLTYGIVRIAAGGAGIVTFTGSNTFSKLERSGTGTKNVRFTAGTTTTLAGGADAFFGTGDGANQWTIDTSSAGSAATIASSVNLVSDWLSLKDSTGPSGTNYAGANSTNVSGNTNWTFTAPQDPPTIDSIDPTSGSTEGGTEVTITCTDPTGASVTFGGDAATDVQVVNDTTVTCVTPAHAAGAVDVVLTTPGGSDTLEDGFTYADLTAPTAASWATNTDGDEITATLSESGCTPASGTGGFTLGGTSASVASWAISGTTLTLTLSGTVYQGQTVTISYNDATASEAIADAADNLLADIAAASVTNNSTVEQPAPPPTTSGGTFSNCVLMVPSYGG